MSVDVVLRHDVHLLEREQRDDQLFRVLMVLLKEVNQSCTCCFGRMNFVMEKEFGNVT